MNWYKQAYKQKTILIEETIISQKKVNILITQKSKYFLNQKMIKYITNWEKIPKRVKLIYTEKTKKKTYKTNTRKIILSSFLEETKYI